MMNKERIKEFLKPTKNKIFSFLLLLLIFLLFVKSYPCNLTIISGWEPNGGKFQQLEFHSLYHVIRYGFKWELPAKDMSKFHSLNPKFLLLYFVYIPFLYLITCLIFHLNRIKFFNISKFKIIFSILLISPSIFSNWLYDFFRIGATDSSKIGEIIFDILVLPAHLANFLLLNVIELPTFLSGEPYPESSRLIVQRISEEIFFIYLLIFGFVISYLFSCLVASMYSKLKSRNF